MKYSYLKEYRRIIKFRKRIMDYYGVGEIEAIFIMFEIDKMMESIRKVKEEVEK